MRASGIEYLDLARWARLGMFLLAAAVGMGAGGCKGKSGEAQQQAQEQQQLGCQSDRDCKGDRICVDHECMDPPTPLAAEPEKKTRPQVREAMRTRNQITWFKIKFDEWFEKNPPDKCPASLEELVVKAAFRDYKTDAWGNDFIVLCGDTAPEGQKYGIISVGPDGNEGTSDDIRSW